MLMVFFVKIFLVFELMTKLRSRMAFLYLPTLVYVFIYICLSVMGKYEGLIKVMNKLNDGACLCASSEESWQPYKILFSRYDSAEYSSSLGYLFYPLVSLDQRYWHPNIKSIDYSWTEKELDEYKKIVFIKELKSPESKEKNPGK